ncbi:hypothetical protein KCP76_00615 [Salmonella enterica subsp. enterica serovar Weltevreden]|nr:hypothetical protein KCP76_00615 [Salmonella enterica subsp. enterica serovar Weltevreden]
MRDWQCSPKTGVSVLNAACGGPKGERSESKPRHYVRRGFCAPSVSGCANNARWDRPQIRFGTSNIALTCAEQPQHFFTLYPAIIKPELLHE